MPEPFVTVIRECNTFRFFVSTGPKSKLVNVEQYTDFTGTILESEFPDGDTMTWRGQAPLHFTDRQAVNLIGRRLLERWEDIRGDEEYKDD